MQIVELEAHLSAAVAEARRRQATGTESTE
jgi:hypothetical protein